MWFHLDHHHYHHFICHLDPVQWRPSWGFDQKALYVPPSSSPPKPPWSGSWMQDVIDVSSFIACHKKITIWSFNHHHQKLLPLLLDLLLPPLTLVEVCKVVSNDGDGQGHHQHPADGAHRANNLIIMVDSFLCKSPWTACVEPRNWPLFHRFII